jgi:3-methyl-2-oxobutanoate hydroxymethyltransferase
MIYHTQAVCNGAKLPLIVLDMPFGSYTTAEQAVLNATRAYQETNAQAIKIEGGKERAHIVEALTQNSIAVLGHIGLMPQFLRSDGGYKIRGKDQADIDALVEDAKGQLWLEMLNLDMLINSVALPPELNKIAIETNGTMLDILTAGATGEF